MRAIYKRELGSYMNRVAGYIYMAFLLLFAALICLYLNVPVGSAGFENMLNMLAALLILVMPLLAVQGMSAERRSRNDRWLYSLPIQLHEVVLGKYFAMLTLFGSCCAVLAVYPLLLRSFGMASLSVAYTSLIGFFLLGAAVLALCVFLVALTSNAFVGVLIGVGGTLVLYLFDLFASVIPVDAIATALSALSPFSRFSSICNGAFDLTSLLYDVCFAVFFLYLTYQMMEHKRRR